MTFFELAKNIAAVIGCVLSIISLVTLCTKSGRNLIHNIISKNTEDLAQANQHQEDDIREIKNAIKSIKEKIKTQEEFTKQQCRDTIKNIYYKYYHEKKIPLYERKTADNTFTLYTEKYNGNSYASLLYSEICKWEIDTHLHLEDDE